ncbi:MAG: hypothetical protein ACI8UD_003795 [Planctomycetota bacterium]|jgi:hypothetical protein
MKRSYRFALVAILIATTVAISGCSTTYERRNPIGERFPTVRAAALDESIVAIPDNFVGKEVLLFIGYEMDSQFDIDRWLLGLTQLEVDVAVYELPTIPGLIPGMFGSVINNGMRSGIPQEDWAIVATVYDDADAIARFLGNETPLPARVVLLDKQGKVAFFHDRGYSTKSLIRMNAQLAELRKQP